ncbi:glycosyltransferase family 2 protein [Alkalihalobacillus sp. AL-G]|uniref:glycosyltransferase family 2 protein n=1 Tax=Alkalihalobacillus sp. AL-G TaxID=2926399 RepID=UPI002729AAED|nr:glycosyltransferase family 2 protein [Alkalihalobacillus sp. AL-G]WLD94940.1 glycosyltransferase [Alkalihalobacillus sp. AL-G]
MDKSEVTVLTASYNPGSFLKQAIDSVRSQTYSGWRHIIIDDASTDDSLSLISDHLQDPRVLLLRNKQNLGQSKAQNRGLEHVDTPYILMLDSDDWLFPYTIEVLLEETKKVSEDVALICGNKQVIYEYGGKVLGQVSETWGQTFDDRYTFILANYVPYPRLYRTSALLKVGGWPTDDPYEGRYLEDRRMDVKLIEHYKIHWIDRMLYNYRKREDSLSAKFSQINDMIEWNIRDALKRWGDHYEPVFQIKNGTKKLERLNPLNE